MSNSSLCSDVVYEKEVIFHEFYFETSDLEFEVSKSSIWTHTTLCDHGATRVFFSFINISQLQRPIKLKFSQVVILCIKLCWDTPTVKTSLWQLPKVSSVFKQKTKTKFLFIPQQFLFTYQAPTVKKKKSILNGHLTPTLSKHFCPTNIIVTQ